MRVLDLGIISYKKAWEIQKKLWEEVFNGGEEVFIILRHLPVITLGRRAHKENIIAEENLLKEKKVEVFNVERGGDVTFHGPGQWVGYPIIDLRRRKRDVHLYIRNLEEVIIRTLKDYSIEGIRIPKMTGVWVGKKKIASIGVAISHWVTYHGFAFDIKDEKEYFRLINPCGLGKEMTSLEEKLGRKINMNEVKEIIEKKFNEIFG